MAFELKSQSPDGRFHLFVDAWDVRNSHWIESPQLRDMETGEVILQFSSASWSLDRSDWTADQVVELTLRKYPGHHAPVHFVITVDCGRGTAELKSHPHVPLKELEPLLEQQIAWK
jgi:hypothetical protein